MQAPLEGRIGEHPRHLDQPQIQVHILVLQEVLEVEDREVISDKTEEENVTEESKKSAKLVPLERPEVPRQGVQVPQGVIQASMGGRQVLL